MFFFFSPHIKNPSWFLSSDLNSSHLIAAYQPQNASSLAASYLRISGSGGNANLDPAVVGTGTAPTWDAINGWIFNGSSQFLATGVVSLATYTTIVKFTELQTSTDVVVGGRTSGSNGKFIQPSSGSKVNYTNGSTVSVSPNLASGVLAIAGTSAYRNGIPEGTSLGAHNNTTIADYIGALNSNGTAGVWFYGYVQAIAYYDTVLSATQVLEISRNLNSLTSSRIHGVQGVSGHKISFGNILQYERTQAWSARVELQTWSAYNSEAIIFTNVANEAGYPGYELWLSNGKPCVRIINTMNGDAPNGNIGVITTTATVADGKRHVLWATYDGSSQAAGVNIYLDGVACDLTVQQDALGASIINASQDFWLLNQVGFESTFWLKNGRVRSFAFDDIERDAAFIEANSIIGEMPSPIANRQLLLKFEEGTGLTVEDYSGNGYEGTLSSAGIWI